MSFIGDLLTRMVSFRITIGDKLNWLNANKVPYTGADKTVNLGTQSLLINGDFEKRSTTFEKNILGTGTASGTNLRKYLNVAQLISNISVNNGIIKITIPITANSMWNMQVSLQDYSTVTNTTKRRTEIIFGAYNVGNTARFVECPVNPDSISKVVFGRDSQNNTIIHIYPVTTVSYPCVNIDWFQESYGHSVGTDIKSNFNVEFIPNADIPSQDFTSNGEILNAGFQRDSYYLDYNNFTNTPTITVTGVEEAIDKNNVVKFSNQTGADKSITWRIENFSGNWARNYIKIIDSDTTPNEFVMGAYGMSNKLSFNYFGYGAYNSQENLRFYQDKTIRIGANKLAVSPLSKSSLTSTLLLTHSSAMGAGKVINNTVVDITVGGTNTTKTVTNNVSQVNFDDGDSYLLRFNIPPNMNNDATKILFVGSGTNATAVIINSNKDEPTRIKGDGASILVYKIGDTIYHKFSDGYYDY